jgi:hypothetical protein
MVVHARPLSGGRSARRNEADARGLAVWASADAMNRYIEAFRIAGLK